MLRTLLDKTIKKVMVKKLCYMKATYTYNSLSVLENTTEFNQFLIRF